MKTSLTKIREDEKGFTLVELAVVMIIIGILIGGILKGQELITNARVTSTTSEMESLSAAVDTFTDIYSAIPGDMITASNRLPNCNANPCNNGDGDGSIDQGVGVLPALNAENVFFFNHLLAADLIGGFDGSNGLAFGSALPTAPVGGGYTVGNSVISAASFTPVRAGTYIVLNGAPAAVAAGSGILTTTQAARMDRRIDDGNPNGGSFLGQDVAGECVNAVGDAVYDEATQTSVCAVAYRVR